MKILTKDEEEAHYNATVRGGLLGGAAGLTLGTAAVWAASRRFPMIANTTLPFKAFLITSSSTFLGIVEADRASRAFDNAVNPEKRLLAEEMIAAEQTHKREVALPQRARDWMGEHRYPIVFSSWVASMGAALAIVGRDRYLTSQQKLVQARVYAQGLTLAVLLASFAIEANDKRHSKGRWETVKVLDPNDPTHKHLIEKRVHHERYAGEDQWREMVAAEEDKINARRRAVMDQEKRDSREAAEKRKSHKTEAQQ